jgi:hypothetical protein
MNGFRQLYAFFIIEFASRRVVHIGVTRHPHDAWWRNSFARRRRWMSRKVKKTFSGFSQTLQHSLDQRAWPRATAEWVDASGEWTYGVR